MTSKTLSLMVGLVLLAMVTFFGTRAYIVYKAPINVMSKIEDRIVMAAGEWNACFHNQVYGPRYNSAKRANPDSIISVMAYDLEKGPVRVSGEVWPLYWSLSLYQQNSDNYFVVNDQQLDGVQFNFILTLDSEDVRQFDGKAIVSPTKKGIMVIRRFASNEADMVGIIKNQTDTYCGPA